MSVMKCLSTYCSRVTTHGHMRGLCINCYSKAKKMVEVGMTTWEELASMGLALVDEDIDPFTQAFNEKRKEANNAEHK